MIMINNNTQIRNFFLSYVCNNTTAIYYVIVNTMFCVYVASKYQKVQNTNTGPRYDY